MVSVRQRAQGKFDRERELAVPRGQLTQVATLVKHVAAVNGSVLSPAVLAQAVEDIEQDLSDLFWIAGQSFDEQSAWGVQAEDQFLQTAAKGEDAETDEHWSLAAEGAEWDAAHAIQFTPELAAAATALAMELVGERWVLLSHGARSDVAGELLHDIRNAYGRIGGVPLAQPASTSRARRSGA